MHHGGQRRVLDASELLYEIGRRIQAVSLVMRKHKVLPTQQLCECGRLAARTVPAFGLRCEVAATEWQVAHSAMHRFLGQGHTDRPVGIAQVPRG